MRKPDFVACGQQAQICQPSMQSNQHLCYSLVILPRVEVYNFQTPELYEFKLLNLQDAYKNE